MKNEFIQEVYDALQGELREGFEIPGIKNLFAVGSKCEQLYSEIYDAERRLEARLGTPAYDDDVELIISNMSEIQQEMCFYMYYYGAKFGMRE